MTINHHVKNWFHFFNRGRRALNYQIREGLSKTAVVPENLDTVRELIIQNRHVTIIKTALSANLAVYALQFSDKSAVNIV